MVILIFGKKKTFDRLLGHISNIYYTVELDTTEATKKIMIIIYQCYLSHSWGPEFLQRERERERSQAVHDDRGCWRKW